MMISTYNIGSKDRERRGRVAGIVIQTPTIRGITSIHHQPLVRLTRKMSSGQKIIETYAS
jgi:hypothetical protein